MISTLALARLCGVSQGTVDRALHGRSGISTATRERILAAARREGFLAHPAARELLTGRRLTVGALIPASENVFFMDLMAAISARLSSLGFSFFISLSRGREEFLAGLEQFAARRCLGAVVVPPEEGMALPASLTRALTVISLLSRCGGGGLRHLAPDERRTGLTATRHLLALGHRRILHLTYARDWKAIRDRERGYREAMGEQGRPAEVLKPLDPGRLLKVVRERGITALFCHNDWLALAALRALNQAGLRVPEDLSVLGVDASPTFRALCPGITSLAYPMESVAAAVGAILQNARAKVRLDPLRLVAGATVAPRGDRSGAGRIGRR